jgi:hypothetical protein
MNIIGLLTHMENIIQEEGLSFEFLGITASLPDTAIAESMSVAASQLNPSNPQIIGTYLGAEIHYTAKDIFPDNAVSKGFLRSNRSRLV